tara:strand:+ start:475 stop:813 length:339 start_codon:yes stop_codon:yes gene_type:complete
MKDNDRVTIHYTVTPEEIPAELSKFLEKTLEINNYFVSLLKIIDRNVVDCDAYCMLNQIKEARISLIKMDSALQNTTEVLDGYIKHFEKLQQQEKEHDDESYGLVENEDEHS